MYVHKQVCVKSIYILIHCSNKQFHIFVAYNNECLLLSQATCWLQIIWRFCSTALLGDPGWQKARHLKGRLSLWQGNGLREWCTSEHLLLVKQIQSYDQSKRIRNCISIMCLIWRKIEIWDVNYFLFTFPTYGYYYNEIIISYGCSNNYSLKYFVGIEL